MKHCPACNFSFPDFHLVCDFDGTELLPDPARPSLIETPARQTFLRRVVTSPKLLTTLAILSVFLGTAFLAYYQETSRLARTANVQVPPVSLNQTAERSPRSDRLVWSTDSPVAAAKRAKSPRVVHRSSSARQSVAKLRPEKRNEHPASQFEAARQIDGPSEKQPKLVAMLKSTWHVLKKPFRF
jgi:hypothetical protein